MSNIFLTSDQHYGHANIITFKREDGTSLRPFTSIEEMNETLIDNHNRVVSKNDKIYFLGDMGYVNVTQFDSFMGRLNGTKILIRGNHDDHLKLHQLAKHFKDVRAMHILDKMLLTHIPIHPSSLGRWRVNVHGHLHANIIRHADTNEEDLRYLNVCVEHTNYTPIDFETVRSIVNSRGL
jgi:calcineurin-like phosphoesterase family protein